jgi:hypothetical protein
MTRKSRFFYCMQLEWKVVSFEQNLPYHFCAALISDLCKVCSVGSDLSDVSHIFLMEEDMDGWDREMQAVSRAQRSLLVSICMILVIVRIYVYNVYIACIFLERMSMRNLFYYPDNACLHRWAN